MSKNKSKNTFSFNGKKCWCGSINTLDGIIEETHSYNKASSYDFHHSFYFTDTSIEKMDNGDCLFFYVDNNGSINLDPVGRGLDVGAKYNKNILVEKIKKQIQIIVD